MIEKQYDTVIIGCGAAGMSAAIAIHDNGFKVAIIDRELHMGGILLQCIHNGFGLHHFGEELTGPEYAERLITDVQSRKIDTYLGTTVMQLEANDEIKTIYAYSRSQNVIRFSCKTAVLAMGCRERNRGNIGTPGTRPSGIFTAGLAQRLLNIDGLIPGKRAVIIGSGDIGLIMARRLSWVGCEVKAVVEIMPYPSGITRNVVQCLNDFDIPLYLSHTVNFIHGKDRVEKVTICPLENGVVNTEKSFDVECDTVLLSVGLVPENELSEKAGIEIYRDTNGPLVDSNLMTNIKGIFACGNALHVHDLVDFASEESLRCGCSVAAYLSGKMPVSKQIRTGSGPNVKYVVPSKINPGQENHLYLRPLIVKNGAELSISIDGKSIKTEKLRHIQPSEMISLKLSQDDFKDIAVTDESSIEVSIQ